MFDVVETNNEATNDSKKRDEVDTTNRDEERGNDDLVT